MWEKLAGMTEGQENGGLRILKSGGWKTAEWWMMDYIICKWMKNTRQIDGE